MILIILSAVLQHFSGSFISDGQDTISDYLHGETNKRLFLFYDLSKKASAGIFYRMILRKLIDGKLSYSSDRSHKLLLVLDEVAEIGGDFDLLSAVTIGRAQGIQVLLGTQSLQKLYTIAPLDKGQSVSEHLLQASLAGYNSMFCFQPGDAATINILQKLWGEKRKKLMVMPLSRYEKPHIQIQTEPCVTDEEFSSLGVGECYVKISDCEPERVRILI